MDNYIRISVQKAHEIIGAGNNVTIVDVRDVNSFAQGHIAQAQMVSEENIEAFLQVTDKQAPLICYCYHGISSQQAALFFVNQGFKKVYSIDGGWNEWKSIYG